MKQLGSLYEFMHPHISHRPKGLLQQRHEGYSGGGRVWRARTTMDVREETRGKGSPTRRARGEGRGANLWFSQFEKYKMKKRYLNVHSIVLPNRVKVVQMQIQRKPKMEQGLLRALEKMETEGYKQSMDNKQCEQTLKNYGRKLESLNLLPLNSNRYQTNSQEKINRAQKIRYRSLKNNRALTDYERVEFEQCLSWAKKHSKVGDYYERRLGKQKREDPWPQRIEKRKNMLSVLSEKYGQKALTQSSYISQS